VTYHERIGSRIPASGSYEGVNVADEEDEVEIDFDLSSTYDPQTLKVNSDEDQDDSSDQIVDD
jgi:hypothetical protein